jgi:hypothetical protein
LVFGRRDELIRMARERMRAHPGRYQEHIYGEHEMGGTSWLYVAGQPFEMLGLREDLGTAAAGQLTSGALGAVPMVIGLWPVLLTGIWAINQRKEKIAAQEQDRAVAAAKAETETQAEARLKAALEKAAKENAAALAREVKKALEAAKTAPQGDSDTEKKS